MIGSEWQMAIGDAPKLAKPKSIYRGVIKCVAVRCSRAGVVRQTAVMFH